METLGHEIAERLLLLKRAAEPLLREFETLSEEMRELVSASDNQRVEVRIPGIGVVTASAATIRKLRGFEHVLNPEGWMSLDESERVRLKALGIVRTVEIYAQARKSAVSVNLTSVPRARGGQPNSATIAADHRSTQANGELEPACIG